MVHTAHLTAASGARGADLRAELARLLGTPCTAVVSGVDLAAARTFATSEVVDPRDEEVYATVLRAQLASLERRDRQLERRGHSRR